MSQVAASGFRASVNEVFTSLPKRTQRIAMFGFVTGALAWVLVIWFVFLGSVQSLEGDLRSRQKGLNNLKVMQAKFDFASLQIREAEERLSKHKGVAPSAFLEQAANEAGVKDQLTGIDERDSEVIGTLKQTRYKITLKQAPLADTMNFLYAVEESGFMAIETVDISAKFHSGEKRLTSSIELIAYATTGGMP
jgi:hypothetical protein